MIKAKHVAKRSKMDTISLDLRTVNGWRMPPFQRPLRINEKVRTIAADISSAGGVVPGILTVGKLLNGRDSGDYLIDGQHRIEAFRMSGCQEALADVRFIEFDSIADMGEEFVNLNSRIVAMRPDDVLRGVEGSLPTLQMIRKECPFVGYGNIRRNANDSPIVSMSLLIRVWEGSAKESPVAQSISALTLAKDMTMESATQCRIFMQMCEEAWGRDPAVARLWGSLNLSLCMWLWRRMVLTKPTGHKRYISLTTPQFVKCLMALGSNAAYTAWLVGRQLGDRDRPGAYARIKGIFGRRVLEEKWVERAIFPQPAWAKT